jgi:hypothetical protein
MEGPAKDHFLKSEDYNLRSPKVSSWKSPIREPLELGGKRPLYPQLLIISDLTIVSPGVWIRLYFNFLLTFPQSFQEVGR